MRTPERDADVPSPSLGRDDPGTELPWRIVTHVLRMPALEVSHPVTFVILVEADNPPPRQGSSHKPRS
jgi:hypothetical protein